MNELSFHSLKGGSLSRLLRAASCTVAIATVASLATFAPAARAQVFSDEFNGTSGTLPDTSAWNFGWRFGNRTIADPLNNNDIFSEIKGNNDALYRLGGDSRLLENVRVDNGPGGEQCLILTTINNGGGGDNDPDTYRFTSGIVNSYYEKQYGYFEAEIYSNRVPGLDVGFVLWDTRWRSGAPVEIDVVELTGLSSTFAPQTIHRYDEAVFFANAPNGLFESGGARTANGDRASLTATGWHRYGVDWRFAGRLEGGQGVDKWQWYIDGVENGDVEYGATFEFTSRPDDPQPTGAVFLTLAAEMFNSDSVPGELSGFVGVANPSDYAPVDYDDLVDRGRLGHESYINWVRVYD